VHEGSKKAIYAAFFANLGIAIAKFVGFLITGASSMLAESIHSLADTSNQGLLLLGGRSAARPATPEHPYGYGRERYFWSFVVALVLFSVGGIFAIYEGISKLRDPHELTSPYVALGILGVAVVLEAFSLRTAIHAARPDKGRRSWVTYIRRSKSPELPVVLLEDLGALFGLLFAFVGVTLAMITDNARFDGAATLLIGVLLIVIAVILVIEMKSLLIGESASAEQQVALHEQIEAGDDIRRLIHMRTLHLGPDELLVAAKVEMRPSLSAAEIAAAINTTEGRIRSAVPIARVIYLEPDIFVEGAAPPPGEPPA